MCLSPVWVLFSALLFHAAGHVKSRAKLLFSRSKVKLNVSLLQVRGKCYKQRSQWKLTTLLSKVAMGSAAKVCRPRAASAPTGCNDVALCLGWVLFYPYEEHVLLSGEGSSGPCEMTKTIMICTSRKWSHNISYCINTS